MGAHGTVHVAPMTRSADSQRKLGLSSGKSIAAGPAEIQNACGRKVRIRLAGVLPSEAGTYPKSANLPGEKEALAQECAKAEACS